MAINDEINKIYISDFEIVNTFLNEYKLLIYIMIKPPEIHREQFAKLPTARPKGISGKL